MAPSHTQTMPSGGKTWGEHLVNVKVVSTALLPTFSAISFCSAEIPCLWQNLQFLGPSQCRWEKWQSHPLHFYCVVVSVAAAHSLDKKRPGKSIIAWVFVWLVLVRGLFQHLWAVLSSDSLLNVPARQLPFLLPHKQQGNSNSSMHY